MPNHITVSKDRKQLGKMVSLQWLSKCLDVAYQIMKGTGTEFQTTRPGIEKEQWLNVVSLILISFMTTVSLLMA